MILLLLFTSLIVVSCVRETDGTIASDIPPCRQFQEIYRDGKDLCERIFADAFKYVPNTMPFEYDLAYSLWFFTEKNPNDLATFKQILAGRHDAAYQDTNVCWLRDTGVTSHKFHPSPENISTFTECFPFQTRACCKESTVDNAETINNAYGEYYRWDRCGHLSSECERFFVQEACFYECDPNVGLFRKYPPTLSNYNASDENTPEWELYKVPIKGDYCDAWFHACRQDLFCGDGDFFECARRYEQADPDGPGNGGGETASTSTSLSGGAIFGIVLASLAITLMCVCMLCLIRRERQGTPIFSREESKPIQPRSASASAGFPQPHQPYSAPPTGSAREVYEI